MLLEGLNDNQLTKLKEKTQKSIDAKDENGKPVLNEKEMADTKAELEAIDQIIKEREKEPKGKTENISQPIELSTEVKPITEDWSRDVESTANKLKETEQKNPYRYQIY